MQQKLSYTVPITSSKLDPTTPKMQHKSILSFDPPCRFNVHMF